MKLTRTVTILDCDITPGLDPEAYLGRCRTCPGARAIARVFPELSAVSVYPKAFRVWFGDKSTKYDSPGNLTEFVTNFDSGLNPGPVSFQVTVDL